MAETMIIGFSISRYPMAAEALRQAGIPILKSFPGGSKVFHKIPVGYDVSKIRSYVTGWHKTGRVTQIEQLRPTQQAVEIGYDELGQPMSMIPKDTAKVTQPSNWLKEAQERIPALKPSPTTQQWFTTAKERIESKIPEAPKPQRADIIKQPIHETIVYEPPAIKTTPTRARDEIGLPYEIKEVNFLLDGRINKCFHPVLRTPDVFDLTGLSWLEEQTYVAGRYVSKAAGFEMYPSASEQYLGYYKASAGRDDPISAIGRGVTQIPSAIVGTPRFISELLTSPAETLFDVGKTFIDRPVESSITMLGAGKVFGRVGGRVAPKRFEVTRLEAVKLEKDLTVVTDFKDVSATLTGRALPIISKAIEKKRVEPEPISGFRDVPGSPLKQYVTLFTDEGKPFFTKANVQKMLQPVTDVKPKEFKIPKAKVTEETLKKIAELEKKGPRDIPGILGEYPKEPPKAIPPAPRPVRYNVPDWFEKPVARPRAKLKIKPKTEIIQEKAPILAVEEIPAMTPKGFAEVSGLTAVASLSQQMKIRQRGLGFRQLLKQKEKPPIKQREITAGDMVIPAPPVQVTLTKQDISQKRKKLTSQLLTPRMKTPRLARTGYPTPTKTTTTLLPPPPSKGTTKIKDLLKPEKKKRRVGVGRGGAPIALLSPRKTGLSDVVAKGIGVGRPIAAFGKFKKRRSLI